MATLLKSISSSDTTIMYTADSSFPVPDGSVIIGSEVINYNSNYMGTLYGCTRGASSTVAASHAIGDRIAVYNFYASPSASSATFYPTGAMGSRLTTESGVPVSTSDRTSQGTIYYTAGQTALFDGTFWSPYSFSERSLVLAVTSGKNYDVFLGLNASVPTLSLSSAWTNDTTRASALALQDGVYVLGSDSTKLYVGTIRASGSNVTEDSAAKRFVWNAYNRVTRNVVAVSSDVSWTYNVPSTFRQANANAANQVAFVTGLVGGSLSLSLSAQMQAPLSGGELATVAIGLNSITVPSTLAVWASPAELDATNNKLISSAFLSATPSIGYNYAAWLESVSGGTWSFYGTVVGVQFAHCGLVGSITA